MPTRRAGPNEHRADSRHEPRHETRYEPRGEDPSSAGRTNGQCCRGSNQSCNFPSCVRTQLANHRSACPPPPASPAGPPEVGPTTRPPHPTKVGQGRPRSTKVDQGRPRIRHRATPSSSRAARKLLRPCNRGVRKPCGCGCGNDSGFVAPGQHSARTHRVCGRKCRASRRRRQYREVLGFIDIWWSHADPPLASSPISRSMPSSSRSRVRPRLRALLTVPSGASNC
jgi:hypothetical protein